MIIIRSILFNVLFYLNLGVLLIAAIPTLVMPRWAILGMAKTWGRTTLWLLRVGGEAEQKGQEQQAAESLPELDLSVPVAEPGRASPRCDRQTRGCS